MPITLKVSKMTEIPTISGLDKLQLLQKSLGRLSGINSVSRLQELGLIGSAFKTSFLHEEAMKAAQLAATAGVTATFRENDAMMTAQSVAARLAVFQNNNAHITAMKSAFDTSAFQGLFSHNEVMRSVQREALGMNDAMKVAFDISAFGSVADVLKSMKQLPDQSLLASISTTSDSLRKMTEIFSGSQRLHDLVTTANLAGQSYQAMIRSYGMDTLADRLSSFDWPDNITVNDDDSITVDESIIDSIEVRNAVIQVADAVTHQHLQKLEEQLIELVEQSKKQLNPYLQALLIPLILGLFFAFFNPVAEINTQKHLGEDDTQEQKDLTYQTYSLESLRLVKRKVLAVRARASSNSRTLGQLRADQVVVLLEEHDGWVLVSWSNKENNLSLQGWVLSKYLRELQ